MTDTFSRVCTMVRSMVIDNGECHADVVAWSAPSECHGLVQRSFDHRLDSALAAFSYDRESFVAELRKRTSDKFVYFSGMDVR